MPRDCAEVSSDAIRKLELLACLADKYPSFADKRAVQTFQREEGFTLEEGRRGELVLDTGLVIDLVYVPDGGGGYVLAPGYDPIQHERGILHHGCKSNREALEEIKVLYQLSGIQKASEAATG